MMDGSTFLLIAAEYLDLCEVHCAQLVGLQGDAYASVLGASLGQWAGPAADYARQEVAQRLSDLEQMGSEAQSILAYVSECEALARLTWAGVG